MNREEFNLSGTGTNEVLECCAELPAGRKAIPFLTNFSTNLFHVEYNIKRVNTSFVFHFQDSSQRYRAHVTGIILP